MTKKEITSKIKMLEEIREEYKEHKTHEEYIQVKHHTSVLIRTLKGELE